MIWAVFELLAGIAWFYFWLRGNWFAAILGMPIGAYLFLTMRAWSIPGPVVGWQWFGLFCAACAAVIPLMIKQGLAEDRMRKNIQGITLNKQQDARFNG